MKDGHSTKSYYLTYTFILNPFIPKSNQFQISPADSPKITSHSMENLAFHSLLRWMTISLSILTTSHIYFLFERLGECTFWNMGVKGLSKLLTRPLTFSSWKRLSAGGPALQIERGVHRPEVRGPLPLSATRRCDVLPPVWPVWGHVQRGGAADWTTRYGQRGPLFLQMQPRKQSRCLMWKSSSFLPTSLSYLNL